MINNASTTVWTNAKAMMPIHLGASRDVEIQALHQTLFIEQTPVLMLSGFAGVGKTALANAYILRYRKDYTNIILINVSISIEEAVLRHCYPSIKGLVRALDTAPVLTETIHAELNKATGRNLMIFDDVNLPQTLQNLPKLLPQWNILLLSRLSQAPEGVPIQKLNTLSPLAAQSLFLKYAPTAQSEMTILQKLLQSIDYQPFLIQFLAQNFQTLRNGNPRYRLADWYQNLAQQQLLQLGKYAKIGDYDAATTAEKQNKIADILKFAYNLKILTAIEKKYLTHVAFMMDHWFSSEQLLGALGWVGDLNKGAKEVDITLKSLANKGWLESQIIDNQHIAFKIEDAIQTIIIHSKPLEVQAQTKPLYDVLEKVLKSDKPIWQAQLNTAAFTVRLLEKLPIPNVPKLDLIHLAITFYSSARLLKDTKYLLKSYIKLGKEAKKPQISQWAQERLVEIDILENESSDSDEARSNPQAQLERALSYLKKSQQQQQRQAFSQAAATYLNKAVTLLESLCQACPDVAEYHQNLLKSYLTASLFFSEAENSRLPIYYLEKLRDNALEIHPKYPDWEEIELLLATAYQKLGDIYRLDRDWELANTNLQKALDLLTPMHVQYPQSNKIVILLADTYKTLGEIQLATEGTMLALKHFEKQQEIVNKRLQVEPDSEVFQQMLAVAHEKLGMTYVVLSNNATALKHYERKYELNTALYNNKPYSNEFKFGLAVACERLGSVYQIQKNTKKAFHYFGQELQWMEQLVQDAPQAARYKHALAVAHSKMGEMYQDEEDLSQALRHYEKMMRLDTQLCEAFPNAPDFAQSLAIAYYKMGDVYVEQGDSAKALVFFEKQRHLAEQIVASQVPQSAGFIHGLAAAYFQIGRIRKSQGEANVARPCFEKAKMYWEAIFQQTKAQMYEANAKVAEQELASIHVRTPTMKDLIAGMDKMK